MEGVTGMMARLSHMQRVAAGGSAMYRTRVFFSDRVRATVATSHPLAPVPPPTGLPHHIRCQFEELSRTLFVSDVREDREPP